MTTPTASVPVRLGPRSYEVSIGAGQLQSLGNTISLRIDPKPTRAVLVCDAGLPPPITTAAETSLAKAGIQPLRFTLTASEDRKTLDQLSLLLEFIAANRVERAEPLIALGGGLVGDLAGFAAATYRRGIPFIQCPTTLLAMVDASVGGKTGANLRASDGTLTKNAIGAFHQPRAVIIDIATLASLPGRLYRAGLAECIKHGMIAAEFGDAGLTDWMWDSTDRILTRDPATLVELISRNVRIKAGVVERDEREEAPAGGRALLNLGHTFAHAIETLPGLSPDADRTHAPLQHGEAVALGLLAATACATKAGLCPNEEFLDRVRPTIERFGLPMALQGLPPTPQLIARMADDKKSRQGRLRLVLPTGPGRALVVDNPDPAAIAAGWDAIRA